MSFTFEIGGVSRSPRNLSGGQNINGAAACSFELVQVTSGTLSPIVSYGQTVEVTDDASGIKVFGGTVDRITYRVADSNRGNNYTVVYSVKAVSYLNITRRRLINASYSNQSLNAVVTDIVANGLNGEGITTNNVPATGPTIEQATFSQLKVHDALDAIAEDIGYYWYIDSDRDLHFHTRGDESAPVDFDESRPFLDLSVEIQADRYYNRIIYRGGETLTNALTESFVGDGSRQVFSVAYRVGEKPSDISVNGSSVGGSEIGIRGLDNGKSWYWSKGENAISQDEGDTPLGSGDTLEITYKGLQEVIVEGEDSDSIDDRKTDTGLSGVYERVEIDRSVDSLTLANNRVVGLLRRFGSELPTSLTFNTDTAGFRGGQILTVNLPEYNLNGEFLITRANFRQRSDNKLRYTCEATSGESQGGWERFWTRLTKSDDVDVGSEQITKLAALTEAVNVALTETAEEITGADQYLAYDGEPYEIKAYADS